MKRAARAVLFWGLIITALTLTAARIFFADISVYKTELEQKILQTAHLSVHIGRLYARLQGFAPSIILKDVEIHELDNSAKMAMQLKEARIGIDLLRLLLTADPLAASWVTLVGAEFDVVRLGDGRITVRGLTSDDSEPPTWLLQGATYQILQSRVSWQDLKTAGKPINFRNLDLVLKNHRDVHEIHLLAGLPEEYGRSMRVSAILEGNVFEFGQTQGRIYVEGENLQGPALAAGYQPADFRILSGYGDVKFWSQWQNGKPYRIAANIKAEKISIAKADGKTLQFKSFRGGAGWLGKDGGWRLGMYDVDIAFADRNLRGGELYLRLDKSGDWSGLIKQLDLSAITLFAPVFLPGDIEYGRWLGLNPRGDINDFRFYLKADQTRYALRGNFSALGVTGMDSFPGFLGVTGRVSGRDDQGRIEFNTGNAMLDAADLFRNTLAIESLNGGIDWLQTAESWQFSSRDLEINSPDFDTETDVDLTVPKDGASPRLDLFTRFGNFKDISRTPNYLPAKIMSKDAVNWLDNAFIGGRIDRGEMRIKGNLDGFPFTTGQGRFDTIFAIENGNIKFHPDWPNLHDVQAEVEFLGDSLRVEVDKGSSENAEIKQAVITIPSFINKEEVDIKAEVQGKIQNALQYLQKTPLHRQVDPLPKILESDSAARIELDLIIPYDGRSQVRAKVASYFENARLTIKPINLKVNNINGVLNFTEDRVFSERLGGVTLGFPIQAVMTGDGAATYLKIAGTTSMEILRRQFAFLGKDIGSGVLAYQAELFMPNAVNQTKTLTINSNLLGVAIDSPDFLAKTAEESQPLSLNFQFENDAMLPLQIQYANRLNAALLIDTDENKLFSGHIVVGGHAAGLSRQAGLNIEITKPEFKLSQALSALNSGESGWPPLREVSVDTGQLVWQGQNLGALKCHVQHLNQSWQGSIDNAMAKGHFQIPDQYSGNDPIVLDMDYMNLTAMSSFNFNAAQEAFSVLPLIDIDSKQLFWRSVNLGKLKLQTERLNNGTHFKKIKISGANKDIDFTADWIKQRQGTSTLLSGALRMEGFGQFLSELGYSDDFKETRAEIEFTGGWNDAPQQFSLDKLNGQLQIKLSDGRISSIEPGLGRLLGLISMEQWAKRLSLNFTDIYRQGLAFDKITGDFKITNGVADTDNLLIDAVSAKMKIVGSANLVEKTLNHRVAVIPKSSGALPIAGTIVDGIATIITNAVTNDYKEGYFFGSEYKVAGPWGNVEVTPTNDRDGLLKKTWHGLTDFNWMK